VVNPWRRYGAAYRSHLQGSGSRRGNESALFWNITRRRVVISYRRFGTNYQGIMKGQESQRHRGGSLKSRKAI